MAVSTGTTIDTLIQQGQWEDARKLLEEELGREPDNHWLLTQLGVTYYEQRQYQEALKWFLASLKIVEDCPLTLWNLAGALDALGKSELAIAIYTWILKSKKSPDDDPCWESVEWTDALKTDCIYRLGICFEHLARKESAERCFREYINLLLLGMNGMYPMEDAAQHIRDLHGNGKQRIGKAVRKTIDAALHDLGIHSMHGGRGRLPRIVLDELLAN